MDPHLATGRQKHHEPPVQSEAATPSAEASVKEKMQQKLRSATGKALYAARKHIVEPVFGQIKSARGIRKFFLALASWCAMMGRMCKIGGMVSGEIPGRGGDYPCPSIKKHAGWNTIVAVWRHTMRATDGLQTTITLGSVNHDGQAFSLGLSLQMSLPIL